MQGVSADQDSGVPGWQNCLQVPSVITNKKVAAAFDRPFIRMDVPVQRVSDLTIGVATIYVKGAVQPMRLQVHMARDEVKLHAG